MTSLITGSVKELSKKILMLGLKKTQRFGMWVLGIILVSLLLSYAFESKHCFKVYLI